MLAIGRTLVFTLLLDGSRGSLAPGSWFHANVYWEHGIVVMVPALVGTAWELASTLPLLPVGLVATVLLWRRGRRLGRSLRSKPMPTPIALERSR